MNITIVEDDEKLRNQLKSFLENNGYTIKTIKDFNHTLNLLLETITDLILLDINLPDTNGEFICREYRKHSNTPIIIVTSMNTEVDEIISINYGADDFITKPYNPQVLLARIERLLKRNNTISNTIKYNDLILDISKSILKNDIKTIDLSKNESKILNYLLTNKERIVSRDELMNFLWDDNEFIDDNTLTVNINRLRSKLSELNYPNLINTKRGQGYIIL